MTQIDIVVGGMWHAGDLAGGLVQLGHDVHLITTSPHSSVDYRCTVVTHGELVGRVWRRAGGDHSLYAKLASRRLVRHLREGSRTIVWSSFGSGLMESDRPIDVLVRGSHHIERQRRILQSAAGELRAAYEGPSGPSVRCERREYGYAGKVTVPTEGIAADELWEQDGAQVHVDAYGFPPVTRVPYDKDEQTVVFVGALTVRKGIDLLARAFPRPSSSVRRLVAYGSVEVARRDLPGWWELKGQRPHREVVDAMHSASALVLLSREEGMARAGMEAMALGTPIVVSHETGLGRWVAEVGGAVVDPLNPEEVAAVVAQVASQRREAGHAAQSVAQSWTWADHAGELLSCL
ncbi:MAG: glycosyltransferase family 4 protein [Phycisphaerae bacterium]|jgi:glycosyltransferase involved in cell wall biosynthesis